MKKITLFTSFTLLLNWVIIWLGSSICLPLAAAAIEATKPLINSNTAIQSRDRMRLPSREQEIPIPADGNCLYTALMIDYLLPVVNDLDIFRTRLGMLVRDDLIAPFEEKKDDNDSKDDEKKDDHDLWDSKKLCQEFQKLNQATILNDLREEPFTRLVKDFRQHMGMGNQLWGGPTAIERIANRLQVTIEEYTPDPDNTSRLREPKLINPEHKRSVITLRIVQDKASQKESVDQSKPWNVQIRRFKFAKEGQYRQHYRALLDKKVLDHLQGHSYQSQVRTNISTTTNTIPKNLRELRWAPSPYECAVLSKHVYRNDVQKGDPIIITMGKKNKKETIKLPNWSVYQILEDEEGILSKVFRKLGISYGYKGMIYCNDSKKQLVLAHRGTDPKNINAIKTDIVSITKNWIGGQERLVLSKLKILIEIVKKEKEGYALATTGHSLGGWLAQLTVFMAHDQYSNYPLKGTTFDTPGAKPMLEKINARINPILLRNLDITNYLSSPNLINTVNIHTGSVYRVVFKSFSKTPGRYTLESHAIVNFIHAFDPETSQAFEVHRVDDWPLLSTENIKQGINHIKDMANITDLNLLKKITTVFKAIYLCKQIYKDGELLGEYSGFFKFAKILADHGHNREELKLSPGQDFDITYKYHYKTNSIASCHHTIHTRHLSVRAYKVIQDGHNRESKYSLALTQNGLDCLIHADYDKKDDNALLIQLKKGYSDIRCVIDALESLVYDCNLEDIASPRMITKSLSYSFVSSLSLFGSSVQRKNTADDHKKNNLYLPYDDTYYKEEHILQRKEEIQRIEKAFGGLPKKNQESKKVILSAWGGAGKTTLSKLYANDTWIKKKYKYIWSINMESVDTYKNSMVEITEELGLQQKSTDHDDGEKYRFLKRKLEKCGEWLLILDNAKGPNVEEVKKLYAIHGGHILVTTRNNNKETWKKEYKDSQYINVKKLSLEDSLKLLSSFHKPIKNSNEEKQAKVLAKLLGYLPLALAQAGHYIKVQQENLMDLEDPDSMPQAGYYMKVQQKNIMELDTPYSQYVTRYKNKDKKFSEEQGKKLRENFTTVHKTFTITIDKIKENKNHHEALRILRVMSYFKPDGISILFFKHLRPKRKGFINKFKVPFQSKYATISQEEANKGWSILRQYGLVGQDQNKFKTHRLIQKITRDRLNQNIEIYIKEQAVQLLETMYHLQKEVKKQNESSNKNLFTLATQLNILSHIYHLMHYVGENVNLRTRLLYLMSGLEQPDALASNFFLPPQASNKEKVHEQVCFFIQKMKKPLLLITGDAGAGKSAYATYLLEKIWIHYKSRTLKTYKYLPIFISLPQVCKDDKLANEEETFDLIASALAKKGLTKEAIKDLKQKVEKQKEKLLLILDSFDEIKTSINNKTKNIYQKYQLKNWVNTSTKIIITCRSAYLSDKNKHQLFSCSGVAPREVEIAPFSETQINAYIEEFAKSTYNKAGWNASTYIRELKTFPILKAMMKRPFMLVIGLRVLPIISPKKNKEEVNLYTIYETFTQQWLRRESEKPHRRGMRGVEKSIRTFCEKLAFEMLKQENLQITKNDKQLASFLQDASTFQSAPLRQVEPNVYEFIQPSYRDFFAASFIVSKKILKNYIEKNALNENLVLFIRNKIQNRQDHELEASLWNHLKKVKKEKDKGIETAHCLYFLYYINPVNLVDKNLSGINLKGGNLSGLILTSTLLNGADLSQTNLINVQLPKNLSKCNLTGTKLPQNLAHHNLIGANLSGQNLRKIKLPRYLSKCNLTGAKLPQNLAHYNLVGANLSGQNLTKITLPKNLSKCNLAGAQLPQNLAHYNLVGANLSGQNLTKVRLPKNLSKCNLTGTQLPQNLAQFNLTGAQLPQSLAHYNLIGTNLSGQNLTKTILPKHLLKCNLTGAQLPQNLMHCNLVGANLSGQNLTKILLPKDLSKCNLTGTQLPQNLIHFNLTGAQLPQDLVHCNLIGANLSRQNLTKIKLPKNLSKCNLTGAQLPQNLAHYNLVGANLSKQNLTNITLPKDLSRCNLIEAQLPQNLAHYNLVGANLSKQNLTKITLPKDLSRCNLIGAQLPQNLAHYNLIGANLCEQNLTNITLPKNLSKCNLIGAQLPENLADYNLVRANLSKQNLTKIKLPKYLSKCNLTGAQLPQNLARYNLIGANLSGQNLTKITLSKNLSKCNLIGAKLPQDLSNTNLREANLTGYAFTYTNLTDTNLDNAILANTTCRYGKAFEDHLKKNKCKAGRWYKDNLPKDLKRIASLYPRLKNNDDKVRLLHIACGFSRLPFYTSTEFDIKVQYWSCALLQLKKKLGDRYEQKLVCSYEYYLNDDAEHYCWSTNYPQKMVNLYEKNSHADFGRYLAHFNNGLLEYRSKPKKDWSAWYEEQIKKNIKGLGKAYSKINNKELQKEACQIGFALSRSYQIGGIRLLFHYLFYQNRLIRLRNSVGAIVKNDIYYSTCILPFIDLVGWSHDKK